MAEIQTSNYKIRFATEDDVPEILNMINELAEYEHASHEVLATRETLLDTLTFPSNVGKGFAKTLLISPTAPATTAAIAATVEDKNQIAGMALFFHNYSTWRAAPGIYLEDLFVRPAFRKRGFGKALLQALARECLRMGCKRLDWSVLKWNEPSIQFYVSDAIGAKPQDEWVGMRVDGERLEQLASQTD